MEPDPRRELAQWYEEQNRKLLRGITVGLIITAVGLVVLGTIFIYIT